MFNALILLIETQPLIKFRYIRVRMTWIQFFKIWSLVTGRKIACLSHKMWHIVVQSPMASEPLLQSRSERRTYLPPQGRWLCYLAEGNSARHFVRKVVLSNTSVHLVRQNYWIAKQLSIWTEMPNLWGIAHYPQPGQNNGGACRNNTHIGSRTRGTNPSTEAKGIILLRFFLLLVLWGKKSHFPMK